MIFEHSDRQARTVCISIWATRLSCIFKVYFIGTLSGQRYGCVSTRRCYGVRVHGQSTHGWTRFPCFLLPTSHFYCLPLFWRFVLGWGCQMVGVVRWLNALVGGGIVVIAHRRVALKGVLLYVHFSLLFLFLDSCPVPGVPSFLFPMMLNNTMLFIV